MRTEGARGGRGEGEGRATGRARGGRGEDGGVARGARGTRTHPPPKM